jgi:cytoskeletal protein RodZ
MSQREIGPRVGNSYANQSEHDVDIQAFIERTPKTNEQINREKSSSNWEYSIWMIVIIGVVIILLILVLWFIFKKDEVTEIQKQIQPTAKQHPPQQQQQQHHVPKTDEKKNPEREDLQDEKLCQDARDNLSKKKISKRDIGPVPGIIPDNPAVVGIKEVVHEQPVEQKQPISKPVETNVPENLPEIQSTSVLNRLTTNFGLTAE